MANQATDGAVGADVGATETPEEVDEARDGEGESPDDRCGFVFQIGQLPIDEREACCWRERWDGSEDGRCVLHADTDKSDVFSPPLSLDEESYLTGAILRGVTLVGERGLANRHLAGIDFSDADLRHVDLSDADLSEADLSGADLSGANLSETNLQGADLTEADLRDADLRDADARNATFGRANLENASLTRANLRNSNIEGARLYEVAFSDTWINEATRLGQKCVYEHEMDGEIERDQKQQSNAGGSRTVESHEAAAWTYRALQNLCRENALAARNRHFYVREKEARRKHAWAVGDYSKAVKAELSRWTMEHGSNPWRLVGVSALVIVVFALLYPLSGVEDVPGVRSDGGKSGIQDTQTPFTYDFENIQSDPYGVFTVLLKSLYFSVVTFATLGYGDIQPVGPWARSLATIETILGSVLVALLVFVLSRSVTW